MTAASPTGPPVPDPARLFSEAVCGIVGYVGWRPARDVLLGGLRRLEYRGYDSAGIATVTPDSGVVDVHRAAGPLDNLVRVTDAAPEPDGVTARTGMGHTRWATHGPPTDRNAHPHRDASGRVAVIHNGIIENFAALRAELEDGGVELASDTDTEVAAHLVARALDAEAEAGFTACSCTSPRVSSSVAYLRSRRSPSAGTRLRTWMPPSLASIQSADDSRLLRNKVAALGLTRSV